MERPPLISTTPARPLSAKDLDIIRAVGAYWYLSPEQVMRLFWAGNSLGRAKERLLQLLSQDYLHRIPIPKRRGQLRGRYGFAYRLGPQGLRLLKEEGAAVPTRLNRTHAPEQQLPHTLACNDVLIQAALLEKGNDQVSLSHFMHEKTLHNTPPRVTLPNGKTAGFELDGVLFFDIREGGDLFEQVALLEVDMGNTQAYWLTKLEKLMAYIQGAYKTDYQTESFTFLVYTPTSDVHVQNLIAWTESFFTQRGMAKSHWPPFFYFTDRSARDTDPMSFFLDPHWRQPFTEKQSSPLEVGNGGDRCCPDPIPVPP